MEIQFIKDFEKDEFTTYKKGTKKIVFTPHAKILIKDGYAIPIDEDLMQEVIDELEEE